MSSTIGTSRRWMHCGRLRGQTTKGGSRLIRPRIPLSGLSPKTYSKTYYKAAPRLASSPATATPRFSGPWQSLNRVLGLSSFLNYQEDR